MLELVRLGGQQYKLVTAVVVGLSAGMLTIAGRSLYAEALITVFGSIVAFMLFISMVKDIAKGHYGVDILAVVAIVSTLIVGEYWATMIIVIMMLGGEALELFAQARAKKELTALMSRAPKMAHKQVVDGSYTDVAVDTILVGDVIVVRPGEVIPVDGMIVMGESSLDESSLTGESEPIEVKDGDDVLSGAVNGASPLVIRTTKVASESQYAQIVQLVQAASDSRSPFVRMADRYAVPFTAVAFGIAGIAWWVSGDARRFAEVLVVATPCPLLLAAPIALVSGMSRAAKHGIIIKNGGILERLATVRAAAFDKTGTLTNGTLVYEGAYPARGVSKKDLLQLAASAEQPSGHVTALAIVAEAKIRHIDIQPATKINEYPGGGVRCVITKHTVLAGKREFLIKNGVAAGSIPEHGGTATYVARDKTYIGHIRFVDTVRNDSKTTLRLLKKLGVKRIVMLTGDHVSTAERIAHEIGITDIHADCLPQDKLTILQSFPVRPIMMVGDGVNDAPVLAASDVGVAMGARGATAASESADVVIMLDAIERVARAVSIAKRTITVARQSVLLGIFISIGLMVVAALGFIPAVVGALLQELVDVAVIINALRAHGDRRHRMV